jgi:hypothetical protein
VASDQYLPVTMLQDGDVARFTGGGKTMQTFTVDALGRTATSVLDPNGLNRTSTFSTTPTTG